MKLVNSCAKKILALKRDVFLACEELDGINSESHRISRRISAGYRCVRRGLLSSRINQKKTAFPYPLMPSRFHEAFTDSSQAHSFSRDTSCSEMPLRSIRGQR